jgi:23S rRNA (uracil1939-C5)-methyltransferase
VIYISCNPATFARDLSRLRPRFRLTEVQPFDMFPQTAEIELAALLEP